MDVYSEILGNVNNSDDWNHKLQNVEIEHIFLDQWAAQKSRLLAKGDQGNEYPIALKRGSQVTDGDIIYYSPEDNKAVVIKIELNPVLVIDLSDLVTKSPEDIIRITVELAHAIGNQHWPAVVKGTTVYVPLTVTEKVMLTVIDTHHIEGIKYQFKKGQEVISNLEPQEIRKLFGGASHEIHGFEHGHAHSHNHSHSTGHTHTHYDENGNPHTHTH
ncbi:urease accessory protein UreE [Apibacter muscae]|uniref:urease accessory protein UreE n=1 Tax=Apibacter muscae TaxID=2509004 RepID=UPI0011ADAA1B|nr:urease accessory protein UreE [Apibacter muscae]TWP25230.1 urease accessory protein UreE [Apibacter muscae]